MKTSIKEELTAYIIEKLQDGIGEGEYVCDLHHELFNTELYLICHSECEKWLDRHGLTAFDAINEVIEYETYNFGQANTPINPEKIVSMLAYIYGQEILYESETFNGVLDEILTEDNIKAIIKELEA